MRVCVCVGVSVCVQDTALGNMDGMLNSTEDTADSSLASALASLETDGLKNQMLIDGIEAFQDIRSCEFFTCTCITSS